MSVTKRFKLSRSGQPISEIGLSTSLVEYLSQHGIKTAEQLYSGMCSSAEAFDDVFKSFDIKYQKVYQLLKQKLPPEVMQRIENSPQNNYGMGLVDERQVM